jgi:hypothetical protein
MGARGCSKNRRQLRSRSGGVKVGARTRVLLRDGFGGTVIAGVGIEREAGGSRLRIPELPVTVSLVAGFAWVTPFPALPGQGRAAV